MRGLAIRCDFALAVAMNPEIRKLNLKTAIQLCPEVDINFFMDAYELGIAEAQCVYENCSGVQLHKNELNKCPIMLVDEPLLAEAWKAGFDFRERWI